jgi:hypothetical protein
MNVAFAAVGDVRLSSNCRHLSGHCFSSLRAKSGSEHGQIGGEWLVARAMARTTCRRCHWDFRVMHPTGRATKWQLVHELRILFVSSNSTKATQAWGVQPSRIASTCATRPKRSRSMTRRRLPRAAGSSRAFDRRTCMVRSASNVSCSGTALSRRPPRPCRRPWHQDRQTPRRASSRRASTTHARAHRVHGVRRRRRCAMQGRPS